MSGLFPVAEELDELGGGGLGEELLAVVALLNTTILDNDGEREEIDALTLISPD